MIRLNFVLNYSGSAGESERAQSLEEIDACRGNCTNDSSQRVSAKRILQNSSQLRISVWNVCFFVFSQLADHMGQCEEGLIDVCRFPV